MSYKFNVFTGTLDLVRDVFPSNFSYAYGTRSIITGYMLNEDGTYMLDEDGNRIILEDGVSYILNEDGSYMLDENGDRILAEDSEDPTGGVATQLVYVSTPSPMIWVTANSTNNETVWLGGSSVAVNTGIPIPVGAYNTFFPIQDVSDLWIIGNINDGISFSYVYNSNSGLTFGGSDLTFGGSGLTFDP